LGLQCPYLPPTNPEARPVGVANSTLTDALTTITSSPTAPRKHVATERVDEAELAHIGYNQELNFVILISSDVLESRSPA
jgi:hypothetical protein